MIRAYETGDLIDDQYRVETRHQGGMSIVYVVSDTVTGKRYALKGCRDDIAEQWPHLHARFEREAAAWVNLDYHPHIVQAHAFLKRPEQPYLLLEYVDGPTLAVIMRKHGPLSVRQACRWARQFCAGLKHAHTRRFPSGQVGLLHRDVKPSNLLITHQAILKISDFGLAKLADRRHLTDTGRFMGTVAYSSPEQLRSAKHVDCRADIFSFGVVLYEMLTGANPFDAEDSAQIIQSIQHRAADLSPIPTPLVDVVRLCLEKSPQRRYQDAAELDEELAAVEAGLKLDPADGVCRCCGFVGSKSGCVVCGAAEDETEDWKGLLSSATPVDREAVHKAATVDMAATCVCGAPFPAGNRACPKCGMPLVRIRCAKCEYTQSAENRYCNHCGIRLRADSQ
jgi:serine/threonine-protein kinase